MTVLTVWEPIQPTDWLPPFSPVLGRMADARVRQFWDRQHVVSKQIVADKRPPQPEPECCDLDGIQWDTMLVYPRGARWDDRLPPAVFFNGPVVDQEPALRKTLTGLLAR